MYVYSQVAHTTQFLCSTARKNSLEWISFYPSCSTLSYSSKTRPHSSTKTKWARGERLHSLHSFDNCSVVFNFSNFVQPAGRETNCADCKADFRSSVCLTAAFSHCGCLPYAPRGLFYISAKKQLNSLLVHEYEDVNRADTYNNVMGCARNLI